MKCEQCGEELIVYVTPWGLWCFPCLREGHPDYIAEYAGWADRESKHARKAEQARRNFHAV